MKILLVGVCIVLVCFIAGCASAPTPIPRDLVAPKEIVTAQSSQADLNEAFVGVLAGCQKILIGFEQRSIEARQWSLGLHIAGAIAGVVGSFGASAPVWAAIAGTMNTMPALVERDGLGPSNSLGSRADVLIGVRGASEKFYVAMEEGDKKAAVNALHRMRASCVAYTITSPTVSIAP